MGNMTCTVAIIKEDDGYVAKDIQTSVASQGNSIEKALDNLKEALELYYEGIDSVPQSSVFTTTLEVCG